MIYNISEFTTQSIIPFSVENPFRGILGESFEKFYSIYEPDLLVKQPDKKTKFPNSEERICRFCLKKYPEASFRKIAHVFPQCIGNRHVIYDSECDDCNKLFGKYEDSFSKFIGMARTTEFLKGKTGVPSFRSGDGGFTIRHKTDKSGKNILELSGSTNKIELTENGIALISTKQPYIPIYVMKTLYKIGYSLIDPPDLINFNSTRKILFSNTLDNLLTNLAITVQFISPTPSDSPLIVRFKKKDLYSDRNYPSTVFNVHFGRYTYFFFLLDSRDPFIYDSNQKIELIFTPPPVNGNQDDIITQIINLSSTNRKENERDVSYFEIPNEEDKE